MSVLESFVQNYKNCSLRYISDNKVLLSSSDIVSIKTLEPEDVVVENLGDGWVFGEGSSIFNSGEKVSSTISEKIESFLKSYYFVDIDQTLLVTLSDGSKYLFSVDDICDSEYSDDFYGSDENFISFQIKDLKTSKVITLIKKNDEFYVLEYCDDTLELKEILVINEEMINVLNYFKDKLSVTSLND